MHSTLAELGTDSMMNIEIKQILDRETKTSLSVQDVRRLTFAKLEEMENHGLLLNGWCHRAIVQ
jgi:hypothetical protein